MRKLWLISLILIAGIGLFLGIRGWLERLGFWSWPSPTPSVFPTTLRRKEELELVYGDRRYWFAWQAIEDVAQIDLYPNFEHKKLAANLKQERQCSFLVSGGFYNQAGEPIGWLVSQAKLVSEPVGSGLLNGYLAVTENQESVIGYHIPAQVKWGVQSGPMLVSQGQTLKLKIQNDQASRRVVAIKTNGGILVFLAVAEAESIYTGPKLEDLPELVVSIGAKLGLGIEAALNLDGGSASAFYSQDTAWRELTWIGSYICLVDL